LDNLDGCPGRCFDIPKAVVRRRKLANAGRTSLYVTGGIVCGTVALAVLVPAIVISAPFYGGYKLNKAIRNRK